MVGRSIVRGGEVLSIPQRIGLRRTREIDRPAVLKGASPRRAVGPLAGRLLLARIGPGLAPLARPAARNPRSVSSAGLPLDLRSAAARFRMALPPCQPNTGDKLRSGARVHARRAGTRRHLPDVHSVPSVPQRRRELRQLHRLVRLPL